MSDVVKTARDRVKVDIAVEGNFMAGDLPSVCQPSEYVDPRNTGSGSRVKNMGLATGTPSFKTNKVGR